MVAAVGLLMLVVCCFGVVGMIQPAWVWPARFGPATRGRVALAYLVAPVVALLILSDPRPAVDPAKVEAATVPPVPKVEPVAPAAESAKVEPDLAADEDDEEEKVIKVARDGIGLSQAQTLQLLAEHDLAPKIARAENWQGLEQWRGKTKGIHLQLIGPPSDLKHLFAVLESQDERPIGSVAQRTAIAHLVYAAFPGWPEAAQWADYAINHPAANGERRVVRDGMLAEVRRIKKPMGLHLHLGVAPPGAEAVSVAVRPGLGATRDLAIKALGRKDLKLDFFSGADRDGAERWMAVDSFTVEVVGPIDDITQLRMYGGDMADAAAVQKQVLVMNAFLDLAFPDWRERRDWLSLAIQALGARDQRMVRDGKVAELKRLGRSLSFSVVR